MWKAERSRYENSLSSGRTPPRPVLLRVFRNVKLSCPRVFSAYSYYSTYKLGLNRPIFISICSTRPNSLAKSCFVSFTIDFWGTSIVSKIHNEVQGKIASVIGRALAKENKRTALIINKIVLPTPFTWPFLENCTNRYNYGPFSWHEQELFSTDLGSNLYN